MTVFVVHGVRDDISPARRFGSLRLINHAYVHGDELERTQDEKNIIPREYRENMDRCVEEFNPRTDYLLIAGDHLQLLALTALLAGRFGYLDVLRYDRQLNDYIPVRLHSGLVPPPTAVVRSGTDIGERYHGESQHQNSQQAAARIRAGIEAPPGWDWKTNQRENSDAVRIGLEAPLFRRDPTKRPA